MKTRPTAMVKRSPSLEMRLVRFEDVPEILRLVQRAVAHGCRDHYDPSQMAAVYASYAQTLFADARGPIENVAAEQEGRIIAFAQLDPASARLRALFVDAALQRRGVGRVLLAEIEARALRNGCTRLHGAMSLNAIPFYTQVGFRPCGRVENLTATGVPVPIVRMEKHLR
jgi:GNAT superfamily N-acetyltransferase